MTRIYTIPAKPTRYGNITFRSSLEALWAEWFDQRLIAWQYEKAAFRLPCRPRKKYKPDFFFPEWEMYGEVKCDDPNVEEGLTPAEYALCGELCIRTGYRVVMLIGEPHPGPHPSLIPKRQAGRVEPMLEDWEF